MTEVGHGCRHDRDNTVILSVANLSVSLGKRRVLSDISLDVHRGEMVGLVGPNGGGKTTLLRAILGYVRAECGEIRTRLHGHTGYLPQDISIPRSYPVLTFDLVKLGLLRGTFIKGPTPSSEDNQVRDALQKVGLATSSWHLPAGALSGGQKKLALLAMLLAGGSELLLLDEPAAALDPSAHSRIADALSSLCADGRTAVVMATHDAELVSQLDRAIHVDGDSMPTANSTSARRGLETRV